jgi:hypothetical protein
VIQHPIESKRRQVAPQIAARAAVTIMLAPRVFAAALLANNYSTPYKAGSFISTEKNLPWTIAAGSGDVVSVRSDSDPSIIAAYAKSYPFEVRYTIFPKIVSCSFQISTWTGDTVNHISSGDLIVEAGMLKVMNRLGHLISYPLGDKSKLKGALFGRSFTEGFFDCPGFHKTEMGLFFDFCGEGNKGSVRLYLPEENPQCDNSFMNTVTNGLKTLTTRSTHLLPVLGGTTTVKCGRGVKGLTMTVKVEYSFE